MLNLSIFSRLGLFLQFFEKVKERLTLDFHDMIGVSYAFVNGLGHFPQVFRQVKKWLILESHGMTVSNLAACPIV